MKKQILTYVFSIATIATFAQAGAKWSTGGNVSGGTDIFGTTNGYALNFVTNNVQRLILGVDGSVKINGLSGATNRLLQVGSDGTLLPFAMSNSNQVLFGDGVWRDLPLNETTWKLNGTSAYYNNGFVGIGTQFPVYTLDVYGDIRATNNIYVGGGLVISEKMRANSDVKTRLLEADSIKMGVGKVIYGETKVDGDVKLKYQLDVTGNATFNGNQEVVGQLLARQGLAFDGSLGIKLVPNVFGGTSYFRYGNYSLLQPLATPCAASPTTDITHQFGGTVQVFDPANPTTSGLLNLQTWTGGSSIDASTGGSNASGILLLNYFCGNDVAICTGNNTGSSNGLGGVVRMGKNVTIGHPNPNNNYGIALNVNAAEKTGLLVTSSSTTNPFNYGVISSVNGDDNKAFAVLLQNPSNDKESISLNANGSAHFGGDQTTMPTLYVSPSIVNNQFTVGKVGIGTNAPSTALTVKGEVTISDLGDNSNVRTLLVDANGKLVAGTVSSTTSTAWNVGGNNITNAATEWFGTSAGSNQPLDFYSQGIKRVRINSDGSFVVGDGSNPGAWNDITGLFVGATNGQQPNVGIGTSAPTANLEIQSKFNENAKLILASKSNDKSAIYWAGNWGTGGIGFGQYNNEGGIYTNINSITPERIMRFARTSNGPQVWIGDLRPTVAPYSNMALSVDGSIIAKEIYVRDQQSAQWADYVFNKDYKLMSLNDVQEYINTNKHLPNVPSACEIEENGQGIGQLQVVQMEKIEEAFLYILELKKELEALKKENALMKELIINK